MGYLDQFRYSLVGPDGGRPWVFLHGLMGSGSNWQRISHDLARTEKVLSFDQRGHGRSIQPKYGYCPEDFAEDLKTIIEELGWKDFILVGHSMGGRNALNFAYQFPDLLQALVIEDIGPEQNSEDIQYFQNLLDAIPTPFTSRDEAKKFFSEVFPNLGLVRDEPMMVGSFLYSNIEEKADGLLDWRFYKKGILEAVVCGRQKSRWHEVEGLRVSTLIMRGAKSKELDHETFLQIQARNKMIEGVEIPDCGHWIHAEQPRLFLSAIKKFVGGF